MTLTLDQAKALRAPFPEGEIGHLPKSWCKACSSAQYKVCSDHRKITNCPQCGGTHTSATTHLSYAGHAEVTDRLLDVDPDWSWEPVAFGPDGMPVLDRNGGMWIRLTIHGTTRLGYGDAPGKQGGNAVKEVIGDAIRNAAMRFGVGLDLWRKTEKAEQEAAKNDPGELNPGPPARDWLAEIQYAESQASLPTLNRIGSEATQAGLSTIVAQTKAAWWRVHHRLNPSENPSPNPSPDGSANPPDNSSPEGSAKGSAEGSTRGYRDGSAEGSAEGPGEGSDEGSDNPSRPANTAQLHENARAATRAWAEERGLAGEDARRKALWRKGFDRHRADRSLHGLEADVDSAGNAGWDELAKEAGDAYKALLLELEGQTA